MPERMHIIRGWRGDPFAPECGCRLLPCQYVEPKEECEQHGFRSGKTIRGMHLASECPAKEDE